MTEAVQTFFLYLGVTLFIGGFSLCFIPRTFRYGVFCSILGNLFLILSIIFVKHFIDLFNNNIIDMADMFTQHNIQIKAIILGIVMMSFIWGIRWLKHFFYDVMFKILFCCKKTN